MGCGSCLSPWGERCSTVTQWDIQEERARSRGGQRRTPSSLCPSEGFGFGEGGGGGGAQRRAQGCGSEQTPQRGDDAIPAGRGDPRLG